EISQTCLTYLAFEAFACGGACDEEAFTARLDHHVFLDYAARYWGAHTHGVQNDVEEIAKAFLKNDFLTACASQ
ncbi:hypothetical protein AOQ84DRAFT_276088, partial [Glonium stellatum]